MNFIKEFFKGFNYNLNNKELTYKLALELQKLYLKIGVIISIKKNNNNTYKLIKNNYCTAFIENDFIWYMIYKIKKKIVFKYNIYYLNNNNIITNLNNISII